MILENRGTGTVSSTQTWKQEFSYDRYGNRTFVTGTGHTTTLAGCATAVCNPTASTLNNKFSTSDGYGYDADGSMTEDATGQRFGYDAENHQTQFFVSTNSGSTPDATYSYDGEGRRVKKVSATETTIFVYDASSQVIAEYSTALATTPQVSYITEDSLGSTRVITNENGTVTNRKDFMAFGEIATSSQRVGGSTGNGYDDPAIREDYTGYQKDSESGLEFAQARYYNTQHGRYTSVDPLTSSATVRDPQSFNRYSYALNSPYKFTDPLGLRTIETNYYYSYDSPLAYGGGGGALSGALATGESWSLDVWEAFAEGYVLNQPDGSHVVNGVVIPPSQTSTILGFPMAVALAARDSTDPDAERAFLNRAMSTNGGKALVAQFSTGSDIINLLVFFSQLYTITELTIHDHGWAYGIIGNGKDVGLYTMDYTTRDESDGARTTSDFAAAVRNGNISISKNGSITIFGCNCSTIAQELSAKLGEVGREDISVTGANNAVYEKNGRASVDRRKDGVSNGSRGTFITYRNGIRVATSLTRSYK